MSQAVHIVKTLNVIGVILAMTIIIALVGVAMVAAAAASLLVQSASATTDVMTTTSVEGGEEQEAVSSMTNTTNNNVSNALLGSLFLTEEAEFTSFNPINETYIEISYVGNATIMPPNTTNTINATETGNITLNIQPNGVNFAQGQAFIVTEESDNGAQEENATTTFVELSRVGPGDTGSGTGVVFFSTNSTGQLAFLDNMLAIYQHEMYPGVDTIREWEWKGGALPLEIDGGGARSMGEQEAASSTTTNTNNNVSNALLGRLFSYGEGTEATVNPINETYFVVSYSGNRIIIPPNATAGTTINSTETGNVTINIQPNGLSIDQGQAFIETEDGAAEQEEQNATITFLLLSRTNPDGTGNSTSVTFFSTNSTGQLAFLDNMLAIGQTEFSPEGARFGEWEWKGGALPLEIDGGGGGASTTRNQTTTIASALE
jgi:hypothetical protein